MRLAINQHPNPLAVWDDLPEKVVQSALAKKLDCSWIREYPIGQGYIDLLGPNHVIEVKRSTSSNPAYNTLGQIQYYQSGLDNRGQTRQAVILIYGTSIGKYGDPIFTRLRLNLGVHLWLAVSLADGLVVDLDTADLIRLDTLNTPKKSNSVGGLEVTRVALSDLPM